MTLLRERSALRRDDRRFALLMLGVGARALVARVLARRRSARLDAWRQVWRARKTWLRGYPEASATTAGD